MEPVDVIQTLIPEFGIGLLILCLNYVSSSKINEEFLNQQDVLQEISLALGSTSLSVVLIIAIEFLSVVNISWIGFIFQVLVIIGMTVFPIKRLFIIDLICLISIFLSA